MESKILDVISEIIRKTTSEKNIQNMQATCRMQVLYLTLVLIILLECCRVKKIKNTI